MSTKETKTADAAKQTEAPKGISPEEGAKLAAQADRFEQAYADEIARRESLGLTREQAIACQRAQVELDAERGKKK